MSDPDAARELMQSLEDMGVEVCSRYGEGSAAFPDPATICSGQCEGMGYYPQHRDWSEEGAPSVAWDEAHRRGHGPVAFFRILRLTRDLRYALREATRCDGWHFIVCEQCGGTGRRP